MEASGKLISGWIVGAAHAQNGCFNAEVPLSMLEVYSYDSGSDFPRAEREAPPAILQRYYHKKVIDTELYSSNIGQFIRR